MPQKPVEWCEEVTYPDQIPPDPKKRVPRVILGYANAKRRR
jgi:hypothetical protein